VPPHATVVGIPARIVRLGGKPISEKKSDTTVIVT